MSASLVRTKKPKPRKPAPVANGRARHSKAGTSGAPRWMKAYGALSDLSMTEHRAINRRIEEEFEHIEAGDWQ